MFIVQIWVNYVYWPWGFSSKNMVEKQGLRDTIYVIYTVYVVNKERKVVELQLRFLFYFKAKSPINFIQFLLKKRSHCMQVYLRVLLNYHITQYITNTGDKSISMLKKVPESSWN